MKGIIDSASFKQGKYTPVSHLFIFSPEILTKAPIKAVIVMAGSYSDEVAKILRKNFKEIKVAIVRGFELEVL